METISVETILYLYEDTIQSGYFWSDTDSLDNFGCRLIGKKAFNLSYTKKDAEEDNTLLVEQLKANKESLEYRHKKEIDELNKKIEYLQNTG